MNTPVPAALWLKLLSHKFGVKIKLSLKVLSVPEFIYSWIYLYFLILLRNCIKEVAFRVSFSGFNIYVSVSVSFSMLRFKMGTSTVSMGLLHSVAIHIHDGENSQRLSLRWLLRKQAIKIWDSVCKGCTDWVFLIIWWRHWSIHNHRVKDKYGLVFQSPW